MMPAGQLALDFPVTGELSFASFVIEPANAELISQLREPRAAENCFFVWGEPGVGRTHLLQSLCHDWGAAAYLPFARRAEYSPAILEGLESVPLVCLDDVEALAGHVDWQEALFHLFNELRERGGRLVVTGRAAPRFLELELQDLVSRLNWGTAYQLHGLSEAGKAEALRVRAGMRGIELGPEMVNYILQRSQRDMRTLMEVLNRLDQLSLVEKRKVTIPFIRQIMGW